MTKLYYPGALVLSHLMAIYVHSHFPPLSALCAATTASMGAAAGMAWLLTKDFTTVKYVNQQYDW